MEFDSQLSTRFAWVELCQLSIFSTRLMRDGKLGSSSSSKLLGDTGRIRNPEQFGKFTDGFFEFKAFQVRMPCYFRPDKRVVITHGFMKKKEGVAPKQEIERAVQIKTEYEERLTSEYRNRR